MIKLALDPELVLTEINTWRDATLLTRHRKLPDRDGQSAALVARMTGAAERMEGFLMLLQSCRTEAEHASELAHLMGQVREFRDWLQQGRYAGQVMQTLSPTAAPRRSQARRH